MKLHLASGGATSKLGYLPRTRTEKMGLNLKGSVVSAPPPGERKVQIFKSGGGCEWFINLGG